MVKAKKRNGSTWSILGLAISSLAYPCLARDPAPPMTVSDAFGVNIHFTGDNAGELDRIAAAGFKMIRMDMTWSRVERTKGVYDFSGSGYDGLADGCLRRGIRPLFILDYGNALYEPGNTVRTPAGRAGFAAFAKAAVSHFRGRRILWEIWNEPNGPEFWHAPASPREYADLVQAAAPAIKAGDANALIAAPAAGWMDPNWFEPLFRMGILDLIDIVTVHLYRLRNPETAGTDFATLKRLIGMYAPPGKIITVMSGEWGYFGEYTGFLGGSTPVDTAAMYLPRMFLNNMRIGIPSIWYDWRNLGSGPYAPVHLAAKVLATTLAGYSYHGRVPLPDSGDYALMLRKGDRAALALWSTKPTHTVFLPLPPNAGSLVSLRGETRRVAWTGNTLTLSVSQSPQYLLLENPGTPLTLVRPPIPESREAYRGYLYDITGSRRKSSSFPKYRLAW